MRVIKNQQVIEDEWVLLREAPAAPAAHVIVPFADWCRQRDAWLSAGAGVWLSGADPVEELAPALPQLPLIALDFPEFVDGRCYSSARLLRNRYQYQGELRAIGDILRDQLYFMQRCGFDSFELRANRDPQEALQAFAEFSVRYQPAADGAPALFRYR